MADETKILLAESEIPTRWTNLMADLPGPPAPPLRPDTLEPAGPGRPLPDLPHGPDPAGGLRRSGGRDPRRGARDLQAVAPHSAAPCPQAGARARYSRTPLLQVRRDLPRRFAQAQHGGAAGLLQQAGGRPGLATETGAGQWGRRSRSPAASWTWSASSSWSGQLRPEAVPALDDGDLGRDGPPQPLLQTQAGRAQSETQPARSGSRSPKRSRWRPADEQTNTRSARC